MIQVFLAVVVLKDGSVHTHRTTVETKIPLEQELNAVLACERNLYQSVSELTKIVLVRNDAVFAQWNGTEWIGGAGHII